VDRQSSSAFLRIHHIYVGVTSHRQPTNADAVRDRRRDVIPTAPQRDREKHPFVSLSVATAPYDGHKNGLLFRSGDFSHPTLKTMILRALNRDMVIWWWFPAAREPPEGTDGGRSGCKRMCRSSTTVCLRSGSVCGCVPKRPLLTHSEGGFGCHQRDRARQKQLTPQGLTSR